MSKRRENKMSISEYYKWLKRDWAKHGKDWDLQYKLNREVS